MEEVKQDLAERIGRRLRKARRDAGLTGTELGKLIGKSQAFISDVERGRKLPSLPTLVSLSERLHRPVQYFMCDIDSREAHSVEAYEIGASEYGQRFCSLVDQLLEERSMTWKDLGSRLSGGLNAALRMQQGFVPPRHVVQEVASIIGVDPGTLLAAAGYIPDEPLDRELLAALTDDQVQVLALKIAHEFPTPQAKQFVLRMIDSARALVAQAEELNELGPPVRRRRFR